MGDNEDSEQMNEHDQMMENEMAEKLDILMTVMFEYIKKVCFHDGKYVCQTNYFWYCVPVHIIHIHVYNISCCIKNKNILSGAYFRNHRMTLLFSRKLHCRCCI